MPESASRLRLPAQAGRGLGGELLQRINRDATLVQRQKCSPAKAKIPAALAGEHSRGE